MLTRVPHEGKSTLSMVCVALRTVAELHASVGRELMVLCIVYHGGIKYAKRPTC